MDQTTTSATAAGPSLRRRQRLQMVWMVFASYVVDCALLLALSATGGLEVRVAFMYLGAGALASAVFYVLLGSGWSERFEDHYLAGPQMLVHAAVNLGLTLFA